MCLGVVCGVSLQEQQLCPSSGNPDDAVACPSSGNPDDAVACPSSVNRPMRQQGGLSQGATCLSHCCCFDCCAGRDIWYSSNTTVHMYSTTVQLYMYREQYRECLGIPSQCFFSPKMSDSGGLQDALQYCTCRRLLCPVFTDCLTHYALALLCWQRHMV